MGSDPAPSFVAVAFESAGAATGALDAVDEIEKDGVAVRDAAIVVRTAAGRIEIQQTRDLARGEGIVAGGAVGLVAGLLLGLPVGGALLGLLAGGGLGWRDRGIPDKRLRERGQSLEPGEAVLCVLVDTAGMPKARQVLGRYGEVLEAELSTDPARP
jgi:uncharacterized membrane protein